MSNETNKYIGATQGFHSTIKATLEIEDGKINRVETDYDHNTVGSLAIERMQDEIVAKKSVQIDAVTGATGTSQAYKSAVGKAYAVYQGKLTPEDALDPDIKWTHEQEQLDAQTSASVHSEGQKVQNNSPVQEPVYVNEQTKFDVEYEVVVVGSGGAGLAAATQAAEEGLSVLLCEKSGVAGGSTSYSGGVIQAAGTSYQQKYTKYSDDTPEKHAEYWMKAGENNVDEDLVNDLANGAPKNIEWLADLGIKWDSMYGNCHIPYIDDKLFADRIHVYQNGGGTGAGIILTKTLLNAAKKKGSQVWYDAPVISLIKDNEQNSVAGVVVEVKGIQKKIRAKRGVVLATASIDQNTDLAFKLNRQQYFDLQNKACLSAKTDTGDGIIMGMSVGGAISGMGGCIDFDGKTGNGTDNRVPTIPLIFVNGAGERFVCEDATYAYQYRAIFEQEKQFAHPTYMIFGKASITEAGSPWTTESLNEDVKNGVVLKADSVEEMAEKIAVPAESLQVSIKKWNKAVQEGADTEYGRETGLEKITGPYYAYKNLATNLGAIGGLKITADCQVLDNLEQPIRGLYAAGLNAGGWLGPYYPGSGTAIAGIIHQGRKAAMHLARI